jgi:hypothetical protein
MGGNHELAWQIMSVQLWQAAPNIYMKLGSFPAISNGLLQPNGSSTQLPLAIAMGAIWECIVRMLETATPLNVSGCLTAERDPLTWCLAVCPLNCPF